VRSLGIVQRDVMIRCLSQLRLDGNLGHPPIFVSCIGASRSAPAAAETLFADAANTHLDEVNSCPIARRAALPRRRKLVPNLMPRTE
jgi:hypothetical protein